MSATKLVLITSAGHSTGLKRKRKAAAKKMVRRAVRTLRKKRAAAKSQAVATAANDAATRLSPAGAVTRVQPGTRAGPCENQIVLNGRTFTRVKRGGLSLACMHHDDCEKEVGFGKGGTLTEEEARRRLLAWEADGINYPDGSSHNKTGGRLLCEYAEASLDFAFA